MFGDMDNTSAATQPGRVLAGMAHGLAGALHSPRTP